MVAATWPTKVIDIRITIVDSPNHTPYRYHWQRSLALCWPPALVPSSTLPTTPKYAPHIHYTSPYLSVAGCTTGSLRLRCPKFRTEFAASTSPTATMTTDNEAVKR